MNSKSKSNTGSFTATGLKEARKQLNYDRLSAEEKKIMTIMLNRLFTNVILYTPPSGKENTEDTKEDAPKDLLKEKQLVWKKDAPKKKKT